MVKILIEAADPRGASRELAAIARAFTAGPGRRKRRVASATLGEAPRPASPEARPRFAGEEPALAIFEGLR